MELYVHIPFCIRKCNYCDFLSFPAAEEIQTAYVDALCREIRVSGEECRGRKMTSVFIGGGTPSSLLPGKTATIMDTVSDSFMLSAECEISIEANPGTVSREKLEEYRDCRINRLSFGCQSCVDEELRLLGRIHSFEEFLGNFKLARSAGFDNINVDLMSAIPRQTLATWEYNLRTIAGLAPEHISAYSLIIEEGTPFYGQTLPLPDEETERVMYEMTGQILKEYGYLQYEISNYAKKGCQCRHNIGYWQREDYLGVGLGAASLMDNLRFSNTRNLKSYLQNASNVDKIRENEESLSIKEQMEEFMFLGLRMTEGISEKRFEEEFRCKIEEVYGRPIQKLISQEMLERNGDYLRLTRRGISLSNQVFVEFLF